MDDMGHVCGVRRTSHHNGGAYITTLPLGHHHSLHPPSLHSTSSGHHHQVNRHHFPSHCPHHWLPHSLPHYHFREWKQGGGWLKLSRCVWGGGGGHITHRPHFLENGQATTYKDI